MTKDGIVLIVDEEVDSREYIAEILQKEGYTIQKASGASDALQMAKARPPDVVILDLGMAQTDPDRLLRTMLQRFPDLDILVTTRQTHVPRQAREFEVSDYMTKPVDASELLDRVRSIRLRQRFYREFQFVGRNEKIIEAMEKTLQIAPTGIQALITGESGTGKEVIARALHEYSPRKKGPFIPVNCGAIAEGVMESELFGHERGSFTSATGRREGFFEQADHGTIFLDELGELPLSAQVKLLRVLEQQEFLRVGGVQPVRTDVRIVAATNKDLRESIRRGEFRSDLYFRLNAVNIHLPPLRERREDIPRLIRLFIGEAEGKHRRAFPGLTDDALNWLINYDWPGNIRELRNVVETLVATTRDHKARPEDLPEFIYAPPVFNPSLPVVVSKDPDDLEREMLYKILWEIRTAINDLPGKVVEAMKGATPRPLPERFSLPPEESGTDPYESVGEESPSVSASVKTMEEWEEAAIRQALEKHNGHREKAARELGIGERTLYRKIKKYGLDG